MSDESANTKASQSKHAQKIAAERVVMDLLGVTRGTLRKGLRDFDEAQRKLPEVRLPVQAPGELDKFAEVKEGTKFEVKPFQPDGKGIEGAGANSTSAAAPGGMTLPYSLQTLHICIGSIPHTIRLLGEAPVPG